MPEICTSSENDPADEGVLERGPAIAGARTPQVRRMRKPLASRGD